MQTSSDYIVLGLVVLLFFVRVPLEYTGTFLTLLLPAIAIVLMGRIVYMPALERIDSHSLSGTYRFRASYDDRSFAVSGDLDWFGDISGEGIVVPISQKGKSARHRCYVLISGTYSPVEDRTIYGATITMTPVMPDCPINHGKSETLRVKIVRRNPRSDLDLIQASSSNLKPKIILVDSTI